MNDVCRRKPRGWPVLTWCAHRDSKASRAESPAPKLQRPYSRLSGRALEVPTNGSVAETRQMVERRLSDEGREPANVQVQIQERDGAEYVLLADVDGVFLGPEAVRPVRESEYGEEGSRVETTDDCLTEAGIELSTLEEEIAKLRTHNATLETQVSYLSDNLDREKGRVNEIWRVNCARVALFDETIADKDAQIERISARISELEARTGRVEPAAVADPPLDSTPVSSMPVGRFRVTGSAPVAARRGKAPPVPVFSGEDPEIQMDDWLPSLERASVWNAWTAEEKAMQFVSYLSGRALQEFSLLRPDKKESFEAAAGALHSTGLSSHCAERKRVGRRFY